VWAGRLPASRRAISSRVAEPLALSLIPGPAATLSRWAPAMTTRPGSAPGNSTSTLLVGVPVDSVSVRTRTRSPGPASASRRPSSALAASTGMATPGPPRVPAGTSVRPAWPSLKITAAAAPARWALSTLARKGQVPRWSRATAPRGKPAKSAGSQPLVELSGPGGSRRSTRWSGAVTSPLPENSKVR